MKRLKTRSHAKNVEPPGRASVFLLTFRLCLCLYRFVFRHVMCHKNLEWILLRVQFERRSRRETDHLRNERRAHYSVGRGVQLIVEGTLLCRISFPEIPGKDLAPSTMDGNQTNRRAGCRKPKIKQNGFPYVQIDAHSGLRVRARC